MHVNKTQCSNFVGVSEHTPIVLKVQAEQQQASVESSAGPVSESDWKQQVE